MDQPYYKVTVASLTRGWSYTVTQGPVANPTADVQLCDPLTYTWAFDNDLIPGQMVPATAQVHFAARTADLAPEIEVGDLVTLDVRLGTTGPRILPTSPARVASCEIELTADKKYAARIDVGLTDLTIDWNSLQVPDPNPYFTLVRAAWRIELADNPGVDLSFGSPTSWSSTECPLPNNGDPLNPKRLYGGAFIKGNARDHLTSLLNSHQPGGDVHTLATIYSPSGYPSGYQYVGQSIFGAPADPATPVKILAVPASRRVSGTVGLPLQFEVVSSILTLTPRSPSAGGAMAQLGLDGRWCDLPARARRSRDGKINTAAVKGKATYTDVGSGDTSQDDYTYLQTDTADIAARGPSVREIPTQLLLDSTVLAAAGPAVGSAFISDPATLAAPWNYDEVTLTSSRIPQTIADWLLPKIAPRLPGDTDGDGRLVRSLTIYDLAPGLRFQGEPVAGFVTGGTLTIARGDMVWTLSMAPGRPVFTGGDPTPATVGDVNAAAYGNTTLANIDPLITLADLDYVD